MARRMLRWGINLLLFLSLVLFTFLLAGSTHISPGVRSLYAVKLSYTTPSPTPTPAPPPKTPVPTAPSKASSAKLTSTGKPTSKPTAKATPTSSPGVSFQNVRFTTITPGLATAQPTASNVVKRGLLFPDFRTASLRFGADKLAAPADVRKDAGAPDVDPPSDEAREVFGLGPVLSRIAATESTRTAKDEKETEATKKAPTPTVFNMVYADGHTAKVTVGSDDDISGPVVADHDKRSVGALEGELAGSGEFAEELADGAVGPMIYPRSGGFEELEEWARAHAENSLKRIWSRAAAAAPASAKPDIKKILDDKFTVSVSFFGICASHKDTRAVCARNIKDIAAILYPPPPGKSTKNTSLTESVDPADLLELSQRVRHSLPTIAAIVSIILIGVSLSLSIFITKFSPSNPLWKHVFLGCLAAAILASLHTVLEFSSVAKTAQQILSAAETDTLRIAAAKGTKAISLGWTSIILAAVSAIALAVLAKITPPPVQNSHAADTAVPGFAKPLRLVEKWFGAGRNKGGGTEEVTISYPVREGGRPNYADVNANNVESGGGAYLAPGSRGDNVRNGRAPFPVQQPGWI